MPQTIHRKEFVSFVGQRIADIAFETSSVFEFQPKSDKQPAGLVLIQNYNWNFEVVVEKRNGMRVVALYQTKKGKSELIQSAKIKGKKGYAKSSIFRTQGEFLFCRWRYNLSIIGLT